MAQIRPNLSGTFITLFLALWILVLAVSKGLELRRDRATAKGGTRTISNWQHLITGRVPVMGASTSSIKIIEFSDYQCPFCGIADPVLARFVAQHPNEVVVYRYDMPLQEIHRYAYEASLAANCAELQDVREPYQSLLFHHQKEFNTIDWTALAKESGVADTNSFAQCVRDVTPRNRIDEDIKAGKSLGIAQTPTLIVNGVLFAGELSMDSLESLYADRDNRGLLHNLFSW